MKFFFKYLLSFLFLPSLRKTLIMALPVMILLSSCYKFFYKANSTSAINAATVQQLQSREKYFILHSDNKILGLTNVTVKNDSISGRLEKLSQFHSLHLSPGPGTSNSVKKIDKSYTLEEVHLYTKDNLTDSSFYAAPLSSFNRMDVYELDKGRTNANHILSSVGVGVAGAFAAFGIAFAIACNCPQVYTSENGNTFNFVSGVYSGAVYSSLERTDYLPLHPNKRGLYNIQLRNDAQEQQYINAVQLIEVSHPENVNVLIDRKGKVLSYEKLQIPAKASTPLQNNVWEQLSEKDNQYYSFDDVQESDSASALYLKFKKPKNASKAKLIVHAKNSMWAGYVYDEFSKLFGNQYEAWRKQKENSDPKLLEQWEKEQSLPLMVYTGKDGGWLFQDYFPMTGNTASRTMIVELNIKNPSAEELTVKLETAFRFWDIDFAGIDYSESIPYTMKPVTVVNAKKEGVYNTAVLVEKIDKDYIALTNGENVGIDFYINSAPDQKSYFLLSTGYYHRLKQYEGSANIKELIKFKEPHSFHQFSYKKFHKLK